MFFLSRLGHTSIGDKMEYINIIILPFISLFVLFFLTKLMGYRQVSELSMYDYINGITIGSIACEFILTGDKEPIRLLVALLIYTTVTILVSKYSIKNRKFRYLVEGKAVILFKNNRIQNNMLEKAKMDLDELLMQCRMLGYFYLNEVDTIILEANGKISVLPKSKYRTIQINDMSLNHQPTSIIQIIVQEGIINKDVLYQSGHHEKWLELYLTKHQCLLSDVLLLYKLENNQLFLYSKEK
ncbi:DUF421 domain-containing protein [Tannockella kyphosi]|uniref:DUF421 domain-containing protein n=1 Tax=Tannockella kyphosi TaxID=2899121 RepID=UPI00201196FD|nr:YetF domain-containing protein [Tannockella kyphosi]